MNRSIAPRHSHHFDLGKALVAVLGTVKNFVSKNAVLVIASVLAVASCFVVKPDAKYLEY